MALLFPLGLGLPSRQTIFMLTPPFSVLFPSTTNLQSQTLNLRVSGVRCQVSVVKGKSLLSIEYPASSIKFLNPQSQIRNPKSPYNFSSTDFTLAVIRFFPFFL
jgi:hypothetical protein